MLETVDLVKIYKPKKGVPVKALNGVSLKFPDRGMVFLLGKSGSGKSTLLNVLGGLDRYDGGEIRIKGVSSKEFRQSHFDSYRNTYVGFIFQEYNVLEEFTVGANIALALQLQGKKAEDDVINGILHQVDLDGYGARKPNELSGGQKQRVAIARALVKSPEIIMADEPTGALDSVTGKQVLNTLKKLSAEKLVIVVSHDRDFAETYADRIIELEDGKVIRDLTRTGKTEEAPEATGLSYEGDTVTVPAGYRLSEEDRRQINEYLQALESGDLKITGNAQKTNGAFSPTDPAGIKQQGGVFRLIKSRLPFRYAFPMGASGLKHKKVRLVFTILLSCVAFLMFGLADTFAAYDHVRTSTRSLIDSKIRYASMEKRVVIDEGDYSYTQTTALDDADLDYIRENTGVALKGVYRASGNAPSFEDHTGEPDDGKVCIYPTAAGGYLEIDEAYLAGMGARLTAGKIPDGAKNEIALSTFLCQRFVETGYRADSEAQTVKIESHADMLGKTLVLDGIEFTVVGIVDSGLDVSRYEEIKKLYDNTADLSNADQLMLFALAQEFEYAADNSLAGVIMTGPGGVERIRKEFPYFTEVFGQIAPLETPDGGDADVWIHPWRIGKLSENKHLEILWLDGRDRTELAKNEIVLPAKMLENCLYTEFPNKYSPAVLEAMENPDYSGILGLNLRRVHSYYDEKIQEFREEVLGEYKIVGLMTNLQSEDEFVLFCDEYVDENASQYRGVWNYAIGTMPESYNGVEEIVTFCNEKHDGAEYELINPVSFELSIAHEVLQVLADVFVWIGLVFAVFAALLLSNFIGTSISYKKQEIGILRAIGSRGNDVFRIFFSESFLIAGINFLLSATGTLIITLIVNQVLRTQTGLLITLLSFGPRQVILLLVISLAIAAAASFIPVKRIASKRPIDAIRDR